MQPNDVYVLSLLSEHRVQSGEKTLYLTLFILAMLMIPVSWAFIYLYHEPQLGNLFAFVALVLGISMALMSFNAIQNLKRITGQLIAEMPEGKVTFHYEQHKQTNKVRYYFTLMVKILAGAYMLYHFFPLWFRWLHW